MLIATISAILRVQLSSAGAIVGYLGFRGVVEKLDCDAELRICCMTLEVEEARDFTHIGAVGEDVCQVKWEEGTPIDWPEGYAKVIVDADTVQEYDLKVGDYVEVRTIAIYHPEIGEVEYQCLCLQEFPREEEKFVEVWVDRGCGATYRVGDLCLVYFRVARRAYVRLIDELPGGRYKVLAEGWAEPGVTYYVRGVIGEPAGYRVFHIYATDEYGVTSYDACYIAVEGRKIVARLYIVGLPSGVCVGIYADDELVERTCGSGEVELEFEAGACPAVVSVDEVVVLGEGVRLRTLNPEVVVACKSVASEIVYVKEYLVEIDAEPRVCEVEVDGVEHPLPLEIWLGEGEYEIEVPAEVDYQGRHYVFVGWDDGVETPSRTIAVDRPLTLRALYEEVYELRVVARLANGTPVSVPVNVAGESYVAEYAGYLEPGAYSVSVAPTIEVVPGIRYVFVEWADGSRDTARSVELEGDVELEAVYKVQYYVNVSVSPGEYERYLEDAVSGSGWYDEGAVAVVEASSPVEVAPGERLVFAEWRGDLRSENLSASVVVDRPLAIRALWKKQYYLRVVSDYGSPTGEGWYDEGAVAVVEVEPAVGFLVEHHFVEWVVDEGTPREFRSGDPTLTLTMDAPHVAKATWKVDYTKLVLVAAAIAAVAIAAVLLLVRRGLPRARKPKPGPPPPPPPPPPQA